MYCFAPYPRLPLKALSEVLGAPESASLYPLISTSERLVMTSGRGLNRPDAAAEGILAPRFVVPEH